MLRSASALTWTILLMGCGAANVGAPIRVPAGVVTAAPAPTVAGGETRPSASPAEPPALGPAPPASCSDFAAAPSTACASGDFVQRLASALAESGVTRDQALACLEKAPEAPAGLMRALRAELQANCADVIVGSGSQAPSVTREISETLLALSVGARLSRTVQKPPLPDSPFSKSEFHRHFKDVLTPWIAEQAHAVDALAQVGPRLTGYARAIVALEAGLADMRFVDVARAIQLPEEMRNDPEVRETYLVSLEQALEPRVLRGRDAALVGLGELSREGVLRDPRLSEARRLLSALYAGRRIDALDRLLLPALTPAELSTPDLQLAARLPAFYSRRLAGSTSIDDPKLLRAQLEQGVPPSLWLAPPATPTSPEFSRIAQRGLFQLGQTYFWAEPFAKAAALETRGNDDSKLLTAVAQVLARGPRNAAALMLGPPTLPAELGNVTPIDALSREKGPLAGLAEFNAAYLRGLSPPANDPAFWNEQVLRYRRAQKKLTGAWAQLATELALAASDTEKELRRRPAP